MSFQGLKQVTKTFGIELSTDEKHKIVGKKRSKNFLLFLAKVVDFYQVIQSLKLKSMIFS
jgi:hypothetical protein